jgi:hypothetical protein
MRMFIGLSLAAGVSAFALAGVGLHGAKAADMPVQQGQYQAPPPSGPTNAVAAYADDLRCHDGTVPVLAGLLTRLLHHPRY